MPSRQKTCSCEELSAADTRERGTGERDSLRGNRNAKYVQLQGSHPSQRLTGLGTPHSSLGLSHICLRIVRLSDGEEHIAALYKGATIEVGNVFKEAECLMQKRLRLL